MKHVILMYDLAAYRDAVLRLIKTKNVNLMIVINPNSGPFSADVKDWLAFVKDAEEANAARPKPLILQWFGYVDTMPQKGDVMKTAEAFVAECRAYQRDYRVAVGKGSKTRVVVVNNIFVDDCFADGPNADRVREIVKDAGQTVAIQPAGVRYAEGKFVPGVLMLNPGEQLTPNHYQWTAAAFVVCFEGNKPELRNHIGPDPKKANAVMIMSASDGEEATKLWKQAERFCAAAAITQRLDYQRAPEWWK
jgi:hypothetical protein